MGVCMHGRPWRPEGNVRFLGTGVTGLLELPGMSAEIQTGPLVE